MVKSTKQLDIKTVMAFIGVGEFCDRLVVNMLSCINNNDKEGFFKNKKMLQEFQDHFEIDEFLIDRLHFFNSRIWGLEATIRAGSDVKLGAEEIGLRTIEIRDLNKIRCQIKGEINDRNNIV